MPSEPSDAPAFQLTPLLTGAHHFFLWHLAVPRLADTANGNADRFLAVECDRMGNGDHVHISAPDGAAMGVIFMAGGVPSLQTMLAIGRPASLPSLDAHAERA